MNEREYFDTLVEILECLFKDDDRMDQSTLFDLQDFVTEKLVDATRPEWGDELVAKFPYIFKIAE